jgi:poly-gamma-glutamate synthesis protein (capsule biosynthesis protein)
MLRSLYEGTRYEVERWPLWRVDKNARYLAKHLLHRASPASREEADVWRAQAAWLQAKRQELPGAGGVRVEAVGDLMWLRDGWGSFLSPKLEARLRAANVAFGNLETPVDPSRPVPRYTYETPRYNAPPAYLDAWARAAPGSVLSLCNNHALDQGLSGLKTTRAQVLRAGLKPVGGAEDEGEAVGLWEGGGVRLAYLGLTFGVNGLARGQAGPPGVPIVAFGDPRAQTDWGLVGRLVARARALAPDWVVALPHWGYEYEYWPDAAMRADAHRLVELGVDVILGASPHVLQPCELASVNGWDARAPTQLRRAWGGPRPALVAYSLGNFASILPTAGCQVGAMLGLHLGPDELLGLDAVATVCRRGLGCGWLEAKAWTLDELSHLIHDEPRARYQGHAQRALGPLIPRGAPHERA